MAAKVEGEQSEPALLQMRGISKRFGATVALDDVAFDVSAGEVHALVGENGAGKSTLMKVLSGALQADAGAMRLNGDAFEPAGPLEARNAGVAMIYQNLSLAPHLTVEENVMLGAEPARFGFVSRQEVRHRVVEALEQFEHPQLRPDVRVNKLPPAARQLVEIARAIAVGCRVLVLDEPTSSLAARDVERLFELIDRLKQRGHAIVYISHFIEEVRDVADRVTVLRDGRVAGTRFVSELTIAQIVQLMIGGEIDDMYARSERQAGETVLEVDDLSGVDRPISASFELRRGEVLGIAGLVGAGRTELLRAIFGLDPVESGSIRVGAYLGPASPVMRWKQGVGLLSEDRQGEGLALSLTVADNLTMSKLEGLGPAGLVMPAQQHQAAEAWIENLDIHCRGPTQDVRSLSGGNQQKLALARLLYHDVDVLLMDEPTRGIDVGSKAQVYRIIDQLVSVKAADDDGKWDRAPRAVLVVSSYFPELLGTCDRIAVMCRGRLGPAKPVEELDEETIMMQATGQEIAT